jgi:uncharacterized protein (TIGR03437 family)
MGKVRKADLDRRLEAHFAIQRPYVFREVLKRSAAHWQMYAAVSGSALAMATGTSASIISGGIGFAPQPAASIRVAKSHLASFKGLPSLANVRFAIASRYAGQGFLHGARLPRRAFDAASQTLSPLIADNGVLPFNGVTGIIEPGEWVSILGQNLAAATANWNFDFPTSLAGTSVFINGKAAYLSYVSPTLINLQAPDDLARGPVSVVVTTAAGTATSTVTLSDFAPSFVLLEPSFVSGVILRPDGSGTFGGGTYDILGPTGNSFGYPTVSAQPGDIVELFGVGFGPTTPAVSAGAVFLGTAPVNNTISLYINNVLVQPTFVGLTSAGLYQINLIVPPGLGEGAVPIQLSAGGMQTQMGVLFSLYCPPILTGTGGGTLGGTAGTGGPLIGGSGGGTVGGGLGGGTMGGGPMGGGTDGGGMGGGSGGGAGGSGGGSAGGSGGGSGGGSAAIRKKPYQPKLKFGPAAESDAKNA